MGLRAEFVQHEGEGDLGNDFFLVKIFEKRRSRKLEAMIKKSREREEKEKEKKKKDLKLYINR